MNDTLTWGRNMAVNTSPAHVLIVANRHGLAIVMENGYMTCRRVVADGELVYRAKLDDRSAA